MDKAMTDRPTPDAQVAAPTIEDIQALARQRDQARAVAREALDAWAVWNAGQLEDGDGYGDAKRIAELRRLLEG